MKPYLEKISSNVDLTYEEAADAMQLIMSGESTAAQFGSFVTGLRMKGETVDEIAGMASVMRKMALSVNYDNDLLDTCGTGGDGLGTFNISTAAAFVSAGIGIKIAKHGNRAMSSHTGSADVLESLGININLTPDQVSECIKISNFGFMFAQGFHPAMKHAGPPRREIGIRTVFNILGPLTNPAGAQKQLIGVSDPKVGNIIAQSLKRLGSEAALIVHGNDGLDEITLSDFSQIWILKNGEISTEKFYPESVGVNIQSLSNLQVNNSEESAQMIESVLDGIHGPSRDIVLLNSAAAIFISGHSDNFQAAFDKAKHSIDSGLANQTLNLVREYSQKLND
ncbi:MAG: anthranilate phosphoribosyltransferase [SAR202 cluster bacterium]|nr:MAG: anthranilate phosphoribosyltransferase [SAR202 cluster bacterium]